MPPKTKSKFAVQSFDAQSFDSQSFDSQTLEAHTDAMPTAMTVASPVTFTPRQNTVLPGTAKFPFDVHVATVNDDRNEAFRLRYRAYDAAGFPPDDASGSFTDAADTLATTIVVTAYDAARCVGTLRVCFSQPWQPVTTLPCANYYPAIKAIKATAGGALVEVGRLAIDPDITNTSYRTTLYAALVRAAFIAAQAGNASHILVTTRPAGVPFYKAMLGFNTVGEPAMYPPGDLPVTLLAGTIGDAGMKQRAQNAFFRITLDEIASMRSSLGGMSSKPSQISNGFTGAGA